MNTIGIIGGLGAFAGAELHRLVYREVVRVTGMHPGFVSDDLFPKVIHYNVPLYTDANARIGSWDHDQMAKAYAQLRYQGCDKIVVACNTVYANDAPLFMGMADLEVLEYIHNGIEARLKDYGFSQGLLLQSSTAEDEGMYAGFRDERSGQYREDVDKLINRGMLGEDVQPAIRWMFGDVNLPIILGCTELCMYGDLTGAQYLWEHYQPINTLQLMAEWLVKE